MFLSVFECFARKLIPVKGKDELDKFVCSKHMGLVHSSVSSFKFQLVEHCSTDAEAMGSNPVEALNILFGLNLHFLKLGLQLR